jgi:HD-GYP domain-containing protein (c-di-GMP phosphodiesterase class II)
MRLMPTARALGCELARDIPSSEPGQMPVLRCGATLTDSYQRSLIDAGIHAVWIRDELSEDIEPVELVPAAVREQVTRRIVGALDEARGALSASQPLSGGTATALKAVVAEITESVAEAPAAALVLADLAASEAYTHHPCIDVCALGMLIGRRLFHERGWRDDRGQVRRDDIEHRLLKLGMGLLLHDVGKLAVPDEIVNKPGALTPEEEQVMRGHPEAGAALLESAHFSPLVRSIVRDHHERWDGDGYPSGLSGDQIHELARIAAVADVYDAITSERPYRSARPAWYGVQIVLQGRGRAFDPEVVRAFQQLVVPFPVGSELTLSDGATGVVADVDVRRPLEPVVRFPAPGGHRERRVDIARERLGVAA